MTPPQALPRHSWGRDEYGVCGWVTGHAVLWGPIWRGERPPGPC